jgi:multisubunit Na+/H+ antiporter MnhB subunit
MLCLYRRVAAFGESAKRITLTMAVTFILASTFLYVLKPDLGFFGVIEKNIGFFLPIFGNNSATISSLNLVPWQNVVIQLEIVWFFMLWFIMAIAIRRRFRR